MCMLDSIIFFMFLNSFQSRGLMNVFLDGGGGGGERAADGGIRLMHASVSRPENRTIYSICECIIPCLKRQGTHY